MAECIPVALACGHLIDGTGHYRVPAIGSAETALAECPEGCGWQQFVVEPHDGEQRCLCHPGRHVCADPPIMVVVDLGYCNAGDIVSVDIEDEE